MESEIDRLLSMHPEPSRTKESSRSESLGVPAAEFLVGSADNESVDSRDGVASLSGSQSEFCLFWLGKVVSLCQVMIWTGEMFWRWGLT